MAAKPRVRELLAEFAESKRRYADEYVNARDRAESQGKRATADDARMIARLALAQQGVRDPEVIRFELAALMGGVKFVED